MLPKETKFKILYRASRDGKSAHDFHSKCDDKGPTLTIVRTITGKIFGGYTDTSWSSTTDQS